MFRNLTSDIRRSIALRREDRIDEGLIVAVFGYLISRAFLATMTYRFGRFVGDLRPRPLMLLGKIIYYPLFFLVQGLTGISIQAYARIGRGLVLTGTGATFLLAETIGDNLTVGSGVTVGNVRGSRSLPVIGNNVTLEPGAKILGEVVIGDNAVIAANSLVLTDVPSGAMAMGNPARIKLERNHSGEAAHVAA